MANHRGEPPTAYVAPYESGHVSKVRAGENSGERLRDDDVVRQWIGPLRFAADGRLEWQGLREAAIAAAGTAAGTVESALSAILTPPQ